MHFAMLIPDWNSLESVRRAHSDLEAVALVFFALLVLFDVLAHLSKGESRKTLLEKIGLCFFAVAVLAEIGAYPYGQRNDTLSEQTIGSLDAKVKEADGNADKAVTNSSTALSQSKDALTKAGKAEYSLGKAESEAKGAQAASSSALNLARGAHTEADSFEKDIKSAKEKAVSAEEKAAKAENNLADALQRVADTEKEELQLKEQLADRILSDAQLESIRGKLAEYAGQEYDVTAYWDSPESVGIANRVHLALQMAKWKFLPMTAWRGLMGGVVGFKIDVHPNADEPTLKAAKDLTLALQAEGLEAKEEMENPNNPKDNKISLSVGSKR